MFGIGGDSGELTAESAENAEVFPFFSHWGKIRTPCAEVRTNSLPNLSARARCR